MPKEHEGYVAPEPKKPGRKPSKPATEPSKSAGKTKRADRFRFSNISKPVPKLSPSPVQQLPRLVPPPPASPRLVTPQPPAPPRLVTPPPPAPLPPQALARPQEQQQSPPPQQPWPMQVHPPPSQVKQQRAKHDLTKRVTGNGELFLGFSTSLDVARTVHANDAVERSVRIQSVSIWLCDANAAALRHARRSGHDDSQQRFRAPCSDKHG